MAKKSKDKNAPKRAISAFFFYQKLRRDGLKKEQPSLSHTEIVSVSRLFNLLLDYVSRVEKHVR